MKRTIQLLITCILFACPATGTLAGTPETEKPHSMPIELVRVIDGDTIEAILCPHCRLRQRLRLLYINTPEHGQPGASEATAALKDLLKGRDLHIEFEDPSETHPGDQKNAYGYYGRLLVYLFASDPKKPDAPPILINAEMIRLGHSTHWQKYGRGRYAEKLDEAVARQSSE